MKAKSIWYSAHYDEELVKTRWPSHHFGFGGPGGGYCYKHQSFSCLEKLTRRQRTKLDKA